MESNLKSNKLTIIDRKYIYTFLDALKTNNKNKLNNYLLGLEKLELKDIIIFKYYINHIIVYGNSDILKKIYQKLLINSNNNKYKDYIFALLYYIIIEQKSYKKDNKKPVFNKKAINNEFKKYIMSDNLSIPLGPNTFVPNTPPNTPPAAGPNTPPATGPNTPRATGPNTPRATGSNTPPAGSNTSGPNTLS